jgi:hypothetical protein
MTTNAMRAKTAAARAAATQAAASASGIAIGEADAHVFNCPACARPLSQGAAKCPGCGTRLIMGVTLRRAGGILGLGLVFGIFVGGAVMASAIAISLIKPAAAAAVAPAVPTAPPLATGAPIVRVPTVSAISIAALSGTAVVNGRISVDAVTLANALKAKATPTIEIARALRSLAADSALGTDLTGRIAAWTAAEPVRQRLDAFYGAMTTTARDGLRASLGDNAAYRAAGAEMLTLLAALGDVDAESRTLAATVGLELPPVVLPGAPAASAAP